MSTWLLGYGSGQIIVIRFQFRFLQEFFFRSHTDIVHVIFTKDQIFGWLFILFVKRLSPIRTLLPPRNGGHYNVQCAHTVFSPAREHKLLPKDTTLYTTVIRSPVKRFVSAFGYFGKDKAEKMDEVSLKYIISQRNLFDNTRAKKALKFQLKKERPVGVGEYVKCSMSA